jgi:hypothetical protein
LASAAAADNEDLDSCDPAGDFVPCDGVGEFLLQSRFW